MKASSAPARLVTAIRQMLGDRTQQPLPAAASALITAIQGGYDVMKRSFEQLDAAFRDVSNRRRVFDSIRAVTRDCEAYAPDLAPRLRQHIAARCLTNQLDEKQVVAAMGTNYRSDAYYLRLAARAQESTGDLAAIPAACSTWDQFRIAAVEEGWFQPKGVEVATLYLHMAASLSKIPVEALGTLLAGSRKAKDKEELYFLQPQKLYERACALDPHSDAFAQWMRWAKNVNFLAPQSVARTWHKILPDDLEPVLYLIKTSEYSGSFHTALEYLGAAERIDSLHTEVRNARPRLMSRNAMRQIQQKKPQLAERTLRALGEIPQIQQGDRPAVLAALQCIARGAANDHARAAFHRQEVERLLGGRAAASLLLAGVAAGCKRSGNEKLIQVGKLEGKERAALPLSLARVGALLQELRSDWKIPSSWIAEAFKQFARVRSQLDTPQLRELARIAVNDHNEKFVYAVSAEGMTRGGLAEPEFLLFRAMSLDEESFHRSVICAAAAAELARQNRNMDLVAEAIEFVRETNDDEGPPLTLEQAHEVLRREKEAQRYPTRDDAGPDYRSLVPCDCPSCRRARGEEPGGFDEDDDDLDLDDLELPPGMPPELALALLEEAADAMDRGESFDQFLNRVTRGGPPPSKKRRKSGK